MASKRVQYDSAMQHIWTRSTPFRASVPVTEPFVKAQNPNWTGELKKVLRNLTWIEAQFFMMRLSLLAPLEGLYRCCCLQDEDHNADGGRHETGFAWEMWAVVHENEVHGRSFFWGRGRAGEGEMLISPFLKEKAECGWACLLSSGSLLRGQKWDSGKWGIQAVWRFQMLGGWKTRGRKGVLYDAGRAGFQISTFRKQGVLRF